MSTGVFISVNGVPRELTQEEYDFYNDPVVLYQSNKDTKRTEVNLKRDELLRSGYSHNFGGSIGVKTLDTRTESDRTNWLGAAQLYQVQIGLGNGDVVGATIRTSDNTNVTLSFSNALNIILAMGAHTGLILNNSWTLKDAIDATTNQTELDAIDITTGWP